LLIQGYPQKMRQIVNPGLSQKMTDC